MNIVILAMNAWDHAVWLYSEGFLLRGLIIGLLFSLPLAIVLEIVNWIGKRVVNIWQTGVFITVFYLLELFADRYGISNDTGFLGFIDNIWLQTLCGYIAGVVGATAILIMVLGISGRKIAKGNAADQL